LSVPADTLRHMGFRERRMCPAGVVEVGGWPVKQYQLTADDDPVPDAVAAAAERFLPALLPADEPPTAAFAVLHKGKVSVWLMVYVWRYGDALLSRAASAPLDDPTAFRELTEPLIGCVWELAALVYERSAWVRHVMAPESPDLPGYLADVLPAGLVGS
jgi:hypothetical protein